MLTPIPTVWAGVAFRSRAEARWAIVFTCLEIEWRYEAEGFQLPTRWYLPDFWLPDLHAFAEVKGSAQQWDVEALTKARELNQASGCAVWLLDEMRVLDFGARCVTSDYPDCWVNIPQSARKGRTWYEWEDDFSKNWYPDEEWAAFVERATTFRFRDAKRA
jgi:hypothetical protein